MSTLRHSADVAWVDSGERVVIVRPGRVDDALLVLEGSAATVWRTLEEPQTADDLVGRVADLHEVPADVVRADVLAMVDDALARGILTSGG